MAWCSVKHRDNFKKKLFLLTRERVYAWKWPAYAIYVVILLTVTYILKHPVVSHLLLHVLLAENVNCLYPSSWMSCLASSWSYVTASVVTESLFEAVVETSFDFLGENRNMKEIEKMVCFNLDGWRRE
jgi:hypothetical protein